MTRRFFAAPEPDLLYYLSFPAAVITRFRCIVMSAWKKSGTAVFRIARYQLSTYPVDQDSHCIAARPRALNRVDQPP